MTDVLSEITPEFLLRLLELIVLILTAMVITLQLANNFYRELDDDVDNIEEYMPFETSFVAFFLIGISTFFILIYLSYLVLSGVGFDTNRSDSYLPFSWDLALSLFGNNDWSGYD